MKLAEAKPPMPMARLVDCLVKLGGIAEAQLTLRRHMPTQVALIPLLSHSSTRSNSCLPQLPSRCARTNCVCTGLC